MHERMIFCATLRQPEKRSFPMDPEPSITRTTSFGTIGNDARGTIMTLK